MPFDFEHGLASISGSTEERVLSAPFWGELRVFLAVAKAKSFNRAAELLGTSQPTVSRQVKRLQDLLGYQLIAPTSRGVVLTEEGRLLAASAAELDERLSTLSSGIKSRCRDAEGVVSVRLLDSLVGAFIAPSLERFTLMHPRIGIHFSQSLCVEEDRMGDVDLGLSFRPSKLFEISSIPLGIIHLIPFASLAYMEKFGFPRLTDLSAHRFVQASFFAKRSGIWDDWLNLCRRGAVVHHSDSPNSYFRLALQGVGISLLPSYSALNPGLIALDLSVHITLPLYLAALRERMKARHVKIVREWLVAQLGSSNPWLGDKLQLDVNAAAHSARVDEGPLGD